MPASVRPYVTAGVALVGASVISVTPIQPVDPQLRVANDQYTLTASTVPGAPFDPSGDGEPCSGYHTDQCDINATQSYSPIVVDIEDGSIRNVPANLFNALISIPRAYLDGLNDLSYALEVTGSWWVYTPTNVLGYDPADPPKITAVTNLLIPFKALSNPLGEHVSWWAKANLPMNAGCTGTAPPVCQDANAILSEMFTAPIWKLTASYIFPRLNNPVSAEEGAAGEEIPGSEGGPVPWSGQQIQINPYDPIWNVVNYLWADPETNRPDPITVKEVVQSVTRFGAALWQDFNPFVPGSFLWKGFPYTLVTPFIKPFVKILCPSCDPEHPEDPTPFDGELPPSSQDDTETTTDTTMLASAKTVAESTEESTEATEEDSTDKGGVVADAVQNLLKKFQAAPEDTETATDDTVDQTPVAEDTDVKTETGTPPETKPEQGTDDTVTDEDETVTQVEDTDKGADDVDKDGTEESGDSDEDAVTNVKDDDSESTSKASERQAKRDARREARQSRREARQDSSSSNSSAGASTGGGSDDD